MQPTVAVLKEVPRSQTRDELVCYGLRRSCNSRLKLTASWLLQPLTLDRCGRTGAPTPLRGSVNRAVHCLSSVTFR